VNGDVIVEVDVSSYTINNDRTYPLDNSGVGIAGDAHWFRTYPNPFSSSATLSFSVQRGEVAGIEIYDVRGRLVRLFPAFEATGDVQSVIWDGRSMDGNEVAAGLYFVRVASEPVVAGHKVVKCQ